MLITRITIVGLLVGAVLIGVMIWNWTRAPIALALPHAGPIDGPVASVSLLSPGILSIGLGSTVARSVGLALQGDGTIITAATGASGRSVVVRLARSGRLADPGVTSMVSVTRFVRGLSIGRDGKIAVGGGGGQARAVHFLVALFLPNGKPDRAFGQEGTTLTNVQWKWWGPSDPVGAVAIQDDGKIVAAGSSDFPSTFPFGQRADCAIVRFNRDGGFDQNFGDNGRVLTHVEATQGCAPHAVRIARDGKIVVAASISLGPGQPASAVIRYLPDGTPDRQFGQDGIAEVAGSDWGDAALALDSQDRIVVAGTQRLTPSMTRLFVARYDITGKLDVSFGESGIVKFPESADSQALWAVALQQDGKIVAAGEDYPKRCSSCAQVAGIGRRIVAVRLNANGGIDESFAKDGFLFISSPRYLWGARGVAIQPDGKLLIIGDVFETTNERRPAPSQIILVRINQDGRSDTAFGTGGNMH
jgi:uncharacterized delta-60 repeat protein